MPNWVTNKITAPSHVIEAMLSKEDKTVDFRAMAPFPGSHGEDWRGINCAAEDAAARACGIVEDDAFMRALKARAPHTNVRTMTDDIFNQFIGMIHNYRECGYLHTMDHACKVWGTKWNACDPQHNIEAGTAQFNTAWSCPEGVLTILSQRFPDDAIKVIYADEDIGSNCGTFTLKNGEVIDQDIAPSWSSMDEDERAKWRAFAYEVKGWGTEPEDDE
jgi:hypothetical protein